MVVEPIKIYHYDYREYPRYSLPFHDSIDPSQFKVKWKEAKDLERFDLLVVPKPKKEITQISPEQAYWYGLYYAEGCVQKQRSSRTIVIDSQNRELLKRIQPVFGGKIFKEERPEGKIYRLKIYNVKFGNWLLKEFGDGSKHKRIPSFILEATNECKEAFLNGLIDGDGFRTKKRVGITTSSEQGAYDIFLLLMSLGCLPYIYKSEQHHEYKGYSYDSKVWVIGYSQSRKGKYYEDERYFYVPIHKIKKEYYKGKVFNLETDDHTYGVPFLVHNCCALENKARNCCALENKARIGDPILQPSPYDGGTVKKDKVGELYKFIQLKFNEFKCPYRNFFHRIYRIFKESPKNKVDIGFYKPTVEAKQEILDMGKITGKTVPKIGDRVWKVGRTTSYTDHGIVLDLDWNGKVQYSRGVCFFTDCILVQGKKFSQGGDSTSFVQKGDKTIGSLFAGSDTHSIICKIDAIEKIGKVKLISPAS